MSDSLPERIAAFVRPLGSAAMEKILVCLDRASTSDALNTIEDELAPWAAAALLELARLEPRPAVLALALRTAAAAIAATRKSLGEAGLVWSGPDSGIAAIRSLEQSLRDIILGAQRELWLVSFAAFRVPHLLAALRAAITRGVKIRFLLETTDDSAGALSVDARAAFPADLLASVQLYTWPLENRQRNSAGRPAKLHAKFALADRCTALISSANLTADALERNMEAGILICGGPLPARLSEHIDRLVARGLITPSA